jgi:ABC-type Mn2+/Zn2+ transport system ATPase subunit
MLLLDEPTAGLAESGRQVVGAPIRQRAKTHAVLPIEHDIGRVLAFEANTALQTHLSGVVHREAAYGCTNTKTISTTINTTIAASIKAARPAEASSYSAA